MEQDAGLPLQSLKVDGGACANDFLMEFQADVVHVPVERPACVETTALGAAYLAGLAVGYWTDREEIRQNCQPERIFQPEMPEEVRQRLLDSWHRAVQCSLGWAAGV